MDACYLDVKHMEILKTMNESRGITRCDHSISSFVGNAGYTRSDMTASPCGRAAISDSGCALIWVALPTEKRRPHIMGYYVILQKKNRHCVELCFFPKLQISRIRCAQFEERPTKNRKWISIKGLLK